VPSAVQQEKRSEPAIRYLLMSFGKSILFYAIPSLFFAVIYWKVVPLMDTMLGKSLFNSFLIGVAAPSLFLLLASLRFYKKEGHAGRSEAMKERFRLKPLTRKEWLWTLVLCTFVCSSYFLLASTVPWIQDHLLRPPKSWVLMQEPDPYYFMDVRYSWWVAIAYSVVMMLRAFGDELWFRGYVLPRQELASGKTAWLLNGVLYALFYAFMPWDLARILPSCLAIPYIAQKLGNTWPGVVAQCVLALPPLIGILSRLY
jgi:hypothetical protein